MTEKTIIEIRYLNELETARVTGFALSTLRNHRHLGRGIPYIKTGKSVRYSFQDIVSFMERHKVSTEAAR